LFRSRLLLRLSAAGHSTSAFRTDGDLESGALADETLRITTARPPCVSPRVRQPTASDRPAGQGDRGPARSSVARRRRRLRQSGLRSPARGCSRMAGGGVMTGARSFTSWLAPYFESFVLLRRSSGAVYLSQKNLLLAFDRHVGTHAPKPPLLRKQLLQYLESLDRLSPRGWDNVVGVVWPALAYALRHG